jgi:cysteine desulfurase
MNEKNIIYLDYQATTPLRPEVLKAMMPYFKEKYGNPHSNNHSLGKDANLAVEKAKKNIASLINCEPEEIILTSGATESNNFAIKSIAESYGKEKIQIITLNTEHKCVIESCNFLEKRGYLVHYLEVEKNGIVNFLKLQKLIKDKMSLVSIMHVNNEIGVIQPVNEIGKLCKKYGGLFHTDAAQTFSCLNIDVKKNNIDALSLSAHKIYGPKGIGALYINAKIKNIVRPLIDGGGQQNGLRSGTIATPLAVGFGEASVQIKTRLKKNFNYYKTLSNFFIRELKKNKIKFNINGDLKKRSPVNLNIAFLEVEANQLINFLPETAISTGSACTSGNIEKSHVLTALKLENSIIDSSIRISFGENTKKTDLTKIAKYINTAIKKIKNLQ